MKCVKRLTADQQRLVEENLTIVERVLRFDINANPCVAGLGYEDLYQEGCVWLCNAALTFDPARGSFASYARRVVQNGLIGYCRNVLSKYQHTVLLGDLEPAVLTALEVQNAISSHTKCETPLLLVAAESQYSGVTRKGIHVLDKLYDDNDLNCDNFAQAVRKYRCSREVITAVANLYLRQQIMIDTY